MKTVKYLYILSTSFIISFAACYIAGAQTKDDITRIEFNAGTRSYREQVIITKDSVITIKEDFKKDEKPQVTGRLVDGEEWNEMIKSLDDITLSKIPDLKSPTNKRNYDGASHGNLIFTAKSKSWSHSFDDEEPHESFRPLLKQIRKVTHKAAKAGK